MTEEELIALLQSLSPEELAYLGLGPNNTQPSLNQANTDLSNQLAIPPALDKKGNPEPFDIDIAAKQGNYRQDLNSMIADNVTSAFGGPSSYGLDAFTPTMEYSGDILQTPGAQQLAYYAQGTGYQSAIAQEILGGSRPDEAVANVMALAMKSDEETAPEDKPLRDGIRQTMPPARAPAGGVNSVRTQAQKDALTPEQAFSEQYDIQELYSFANEMGAEYASDPQGGFKDEKTGLTYEKPPEEIWSDAAQWYRDRGLPMPTEQYTDPKYTNAVAPVDLDAWGQNFLSAEDQYQKAHQDLTSNAVDIDGMRQAYEDYEKQRAAYEAQGQPSPLLRAGEQMPPGAQPQPLLRQGEMPGPFAINAGQSRPVSGTPGPQTIGGFTVGGPGGDPNASAPRPQPLTQGGQFAGMSAEEVAEAFHNGTARPPGVTAMASTPGPMKATGGPTNFPKAPQIITVGGKPMLSTDPAAQRPGVMDTVFGGNGLQKLLAPRTEAAPLTSDMLAGYEKERQKRAKADSQAYGARTRAGQAPADMRAHFVQYGQARGMRDAGQTPLNDALMQRILAMRAQGLAG